MNGKQWRRRKLNRLLMRNPLAKYSTNVFIIKFIKTSFRKSSDYELILISVCARLKRKFILTAANHSKNVAVIRSLVEDKWLPYYHKRSVIPVTAWILPWNIFQLRWGFQVIDEHFMVVKQTRCYSIYLYNMTLV